MMRINSKGKMLIGLFSFLLVTPLIIYYLLENTGKFDTRSNADSGIELNSDLKPADLNSDNVISISDFVLWKDEFKRYKIDNSNNPNADLDNDGKVGMSDFSKWLSSFREYKKYVVANSSSAKNSDLPTSGSIGGTINSGEGLILTYSLEEGTSWRYEVTGGVPDSCHRVEVDVRVSEGTTVDANIVDITATVLDTGNFCPSVPVEINKTGQFEAGKSSSIHFFVTTTQRNSQGISGYVKLIKGNCMPIGETYDYSAPYSGNCTTNAVSRKVYVRELTKETSLEGSYLKDKTNLIGEVQSDSNGYYELYLPAGKYSVFVEDDGREYCNWYSSTGEACPVTVENGVSTPYDITINYAVY